MVYIWCGKESGGEEGKSFIILQIALCFIMTEFSFPLLDLENITNRSLKKNLNIVTDKGIQRTYLTAIKINHKTIRICKTNNYSLPQHLLFCVLGFVFNFVHSVITLCEILAIHRLHKTIASILKDESLTSVANLQTSLIFHSWKILEQNKLFDLHIFYKILYI